MIRRINNNNDLLDIIKSCPTGIIEDIYSVRYFIEGEPDVEIEPSFRKIGRHLQVVIPSDMLKELSEGVLMRKVFYSVEDDQYPDGHYNLEFVDALDVWIVDDNDQGDSD